MTETRLMNEEVLQEKRTNRSRSSMARKHMGRDSAGVATGDGLKKDEFGATHCCGHMGEIETDMTE